MPSPLLTNPNISFVVAKPFHTNGKDYKVGEDFPQEDARDIETFVRARFVIPVVERHTDKPRAWHREIRPKAEVLDRLARKHAQIVMPTPAADLDVPALPEPDSDATPAGEGTSYDPSEHTVNEVKEYLAEHPDEHDQVLAAEAAGRARKGLLEES